MNAAMLCSSDPVAGDIISATSSKFVPQCRLIHASATSDNRPSGDTRASNLWSGRTAARLGRLHWTLACGERLVAIRILIQVPYEATRRNDLAPRAHVRAMSRSIPRRDRGAVHSTPLAHGAVLRAETLRIVHELPQTNKVSCTRFRSAAIAR